MLSTPALPLLRFHAPMSTPPTMRATVNVLADGAPAPLSFSVATKSPPDASVAIQGASISSLTPAAHDLPQRGDHRVAAIDRQRRGADAGRDDAMNVTGDMYRATGKRDARREDGADRRVDGKTANAHRPAANRRNDQAARAGRAG